MSVFVRISSQSQTPARRFYRVPRDIERVNASDRPDGSKEDLRVRTDGTFGKPRQKVLDEGKTFPEVYRIYPLHHVVLNCSFQRLWRDLNPMLSDHRWSSLLGNALAWTNNTGFPGHWNCITGEDADKQFPRFDIPRLCSNAIVAGFEKDGYLWLDTMLTTNPAMRAVDVLDIPYYWYYGTSVNPKGETNFITRLGFDGAYHKVRIPVLTSQKVYVPLDELIPL